MPRKKILPLCICKDPNCKIPYGYCHCGCGQKTNIALLTNDRIGHIKGCPIRFRVGHATTQKRPPIRYGVLDGSPVAYIPLTKGKWAIIDRWNLGKVPGVWFCDSNGYAVRWQRHKLLYMHNVILSSPIGMLTDHKLDIKLDNRESQLQSVTRGQNEYKCKLNARNTSGYKGVSWRADMCKWIVQIVVARRHIHLGLYPSDRLIDAAKAYDKAALKYHGKFARLNFPIDPQASEK